MRRFSILALTVPSLWLWSAPAVALETIGPKVDDPPPRTSAPAALRRSRNRSPVAMGLLVNPVQTATSALVNDLALVSAVILIGDGRGACVLDPQAYVLTKHRIGGAGAQVGFRIFTGRRYDGLYFGVRFGGGVGNRRFKTFMGQMDAGWAWAFGMLRLALGANAGGGYVSHEVSGGSLYLFSLDLSIGFATGPWE